VTIGALLASVVLTWLVSATSSVASRFFWNGLLCLLSGIAAFFVAISADLKVYWQTGDDAVDELLGTFPYVGSDMAVLTASGTDYKISIALGACCIVFFFCHSLLAMVQ
jgi:hypothetical protein